MLINNNNSIENKIGEHSNLVLIDPNNSNILSKNSCSLSLIPINSIDNKFNKTKFIKHPFKPNNINNMKKISNTIYKHNVSNNFLKTNDKKICKFLSYNKFKSNIEIKQVLNQFKFNKNNVNKTLNSKSTTKICTQNNLENNNNNNSLKIEKKYKNSYFTNKNINKISIPCNIQEKYQFNIDSNKIKTSNSIINPKIKKLNIKSKRHSLKLIKHSKEDNIIYRDIINNMRNNSENTNVKYESIQNLPKKNNNEYKTQKNFFCCCLPFVVK
jgi:hypothetical protein